MFCTVQWKIVERAYLKFLLKLYLCSQLFDDLGWADKGWNIFRKNLILPLGQKSLDKSIFVFSCIFVALLLFLMMYTPYELWRHLQLFQIMALPNRSNHSANICLSDREFSADSENVPVYRAITESLEENWDFIKSCIFDREKSIYFIDFCLYLV